MRYLSVCSGIEAATTAWHPLGWTPVAFSEIEPFPSAVLAHHYPNVPNWGDMTRFHDWPDADVDVLVGGTPCQSFSVAGLRRGLADPRGNLALTFLAIAERYRARRVVWENVPGVLSADGGRAFGAFLGGLAELGYGFAWRVLDAQYLGLAQRRKRLFVVADSRGWRRAAAVLFESSSLRGDPAPSREAGKGTAPTIAARTRGGGGLGTDFDCDGGLISFKANMLMQEWSTDGTAGTLQADNQHAVAHALRAEGHDASEDGTGRGVPLTVGTLTAPRSGGGGSYRLDASDVDGGKLIPVVMSSGQANAEIRQDGGAPSLTCLHEAPIVAFDTTQITSAANYSQPGDPCPSLNSFGEPAAVAFDARQSDVIQYGDKTGPLDTDGHTMGVAHRAQVRRLTPRECERLQGFPDDYTLIPVRGKPAADGPRYKALGNSMAVPVMRWIGCRINWVEQLAETLEQERVA